jgi:nicotinate-nucleotide adenylyltransferase
MRLGILGGSFDPVHRAHLALARACQQQAALDEVWFTPTAIQPLKRRGPHAANSQRVEMLNLAIESDEGEVSLNQTTRPSEPGHPLPHRRWRVCTLEIDRGGFSYTVDTLRQIHEDLPDAKLFFLLGADTLRDVAKWKEPAEIFRMSTPLVVSRSADRQLSLDTLSALCAMDKQPRQIEMPPVDISSSEIRRRVAAGLSIHEFVPQVVERYIARHGLYRAP